MDIKRRDFVKGCATVSVLLLPGIASAASGENTNRASAAASRLQVDVAPLKSERFGLSAASQCDQADGTE